MVDRIRKIIQVKKLSASAFADRIGVPRSTISHILSGRNNPSLDLVQKILDAFPDVQTEWMVRGYGNMLTLQNSLFSDDDFDSGKKVTKSAEAKSSQEADKSIDSQYTEGSDTDMIPENSADISSPPDHQTGIAASDGDNQPGQKRSGDTAGRSRIILLSGDGTYQEFFPAHD